MRTLTDNTGVADAPAPDAQALARARQQGRDAAASDPFSPNPYRGQPGLFRAWMQGFFEAGPDVGPLPPLRPMPPEGAAVAVSLPPSAPVARIRPPALMVLDAPGFSVRYPTLVNAALIPPGALAVMEQAWTRFTFAGRRLELIRVPGAFIVDEGLAFDHELRVIEQTTPTFTDAEIAACRGRIEAALAAGRVNTHAGEAVLCKRRSAFNYGHYLLDMFPLAFLARQLLVDRRLNYVVDRTTPLMLDVIYRSLYQLGIGLDQMVIAGAAPQRVESLIVVDGVSEHGSYLSPLAVGALESLALTVVPGPPRRLFVLRANAPQRLLANQDEVAARFAEAGYEVIDPGALSLAEQIVAFRAAERVVGVMGAAMANIVFCDPGTPVTMLAHAHMPDTFFWLIANIKRQPYREIRLPPVIEEDPQSWSGDFLARPEDIEAALAV
jgi:hypothetical protein